MLKKPLNASRCRIRITGEDPEDDLAVQKRIELEELYEKAMLPIGTQFEIVTIYDLDLALVKIYNIKIDNEDLFIVDPSKIEII